MVVHQSLGWHVTFDLNQYKHMPVHIAMYLSIIYLYLWMVVKICYYLQTLEAQQLLKNNFLKPKVGKKRNTCVTLSVMA